MLNNVQEPKSKGVIKDATKLQQVRNIDCPDKDDPTALHQACINGNINLVNFLLDKKANVNALDKEGCTSLHIAARIGSLEITKCLVDRGAKLEMTNHEGDLPVSLVNEAEHPDLKNYLLLEMKRRDIDEEKCRNMQSIVMPEDLMEISCLLKTSIAHQSVEWKKNKQSKDAELKQMFLGTVNIDPDRSGVDIKSGSNKMFKEKGCASIGEMDEGSTFTSASSDDAEGKLEIKLIPTKPSNETSVEEKGCSRRLSDGDDVVDPIETVKQCYIKVFSDITNGAYCDTSHNSIGSSRAQKGKIKEEDGVQIRPKSSPNLLETPVIKAGLSSDSLLAASANSGRSTNHESLSTTSTTDAKTSRLVESFQKQQQRHRAFHGNMLMSPRPPPNSQQCNHGTQAFVPTPLTIVADLLRPSSSVGAGGIGAAASSATEPLPNEVVVDETEIEQERVAVERCRTVGEDIVNIAKATPLEPIKTRLYVKKRDEELPYSTFVEVPDDTHCKSYLDCVDRDLEETCVEERLISNINQSDVDDKNEQETTTVSSDNRQWIVLNPNADSESDSSSSEDAQTDSLQPSILGTLIRRQRIICPTSVRKYHRNIFKQPLPSKNGADADAPLPVVDTDAPCAHTAPLPVTRPICWKCRRALTAEPCGFPFCVDGAEGHHLCLGCLMGILKDWESEEGQWGIEVPCPLDAVMNSHVRVREGTVSVDSLIWEFKEYFIVLQSAANKEAKTGESRYGAIVAEMEQWLRLPEETCHSCLRPLAPYYYSYTHCRRRHRFCVSCALCHWNDEEEGCPIADPMGEGELVVVRGGTAYQVSDQHVEAAWGILVDLVPDLELEAEAAEAAEAAINIEENDAMAAIHTIDNLLLNSDQSFDL